MAAAKVKGVKGTLANLEKLKKRYPDASVKAVNIEAYLLMNRIREMVPVKTGRLQKATTVAQEATMDKPALIGSATVYALAQHEHVEWQHEQGKAKFVEIPFKALRGVYAKRIAAHVKHLVNREKLAAAQSAAGWDDTSGGAE